MVFGNPFVTQFHRDAPLEYHSERIAEDWEGVDQETVRSVLRFVSYPRVVIDGDSKVAT